MKTLAIYLLLGSCVYGQNAVTDWAAIVQPYINLPAKSPPVLFLFRAQIQLAVYNAVMAIEGGYRPYVTAIAAPTGADVRAAVATAAYRAARPLVTPEQRAWLDARYEAYMARIPEGPGKSTGMGVGQSAAASIQGIRADDGFSRVVLYECGLNPPAVGRFEPNGGCLTQPQTVNHGQIRPFALPNGNQFRPSPPPPLTSTAYLDDFIETRDYGRSNSTMRTVEQTDTAYFWNAMDWHQTLINLAISRGLTVQNAARYFALVYTAGADAAIAGFEAKYAYNLWRPRTAIPRADADGNPDTDPDATWTPLISVNHPEYPSGHSFIDTAIVDSLSRFFGTSKINVTITASRAVAPLLLKTERTYTNLSAPLHEVYDARIWSGLHWRTSMEAGGEVGRRVAQYVYENFFQPQ